MKEGRGDEENFCLMQLMKLILTSDLDLDEKNFLYQMYETIYWKKMLQVLYIIYHIKHEQN